MPHLELTIIFSDAAPGISQEALFTLRTHQMAYQQDGFLPRPFTIESGRFKDYYFTGKGKHNQESYAVYTHVKSHEVAMDAEFFKLYQIGPDHEFQIMNTRRTKYLHFDPRTHYCTWSDNKSPRYFAWRSGEASQKTKIYNRNAWSKWKGEPCELWDAKFEGQIGSGSHSHNPLHYRKADWGSWFRHASWYFVPLDNNIELQRKEFEKVCDRAPSFGSIRTARSPSP